MAETGIAVIGCGYWGANLVRNFFELGALAAVCDPRREVAREFASKYSVREANLDEIIADPSILGVAIAVPAEKHAEVALRAFEAGKHVFVEKPIALSLADGERLCRASRDAGTTLMVGHVLRYHPAFQALLELVHANGLGKLRYAYSNRLSLGKVRTEEDVIWSFAPHDISMLLALFGEEPMSVCSSGGAYLTEGIIDEGRIEMAFAGGGKAHVFISWLHPFKEHRLVVVGDQAMAVFEDSAPSAIEKLKVYRHRITSSDGMPAAFKSEPEHIPFEPAEPLREECRHFLECVAGRQLRALTDGEEGMAVLRVLSAASGAPP